MNLKDYWTQPPQAQDKLVESLQPTPSYLRCNCKAKDPEECWFKKHGYRPGACGCFCHVKKGEEGEW